MLNRKLSICGVLQGVLVVSNCINCQLHQLHHLLVLCRLSPQIKDIIVTTKISFHEKNKIESAIFIKNFITNKNKKEQSSKYKFVFIFFKIFIITHLRKCHYLNCKIFMLFAVQNIYPCVKEKFPRPTAALSSLVTFSVANDPSPRP